MTVQNGTPTITKAELAVILQGLVLRGNANTAVAVADDFMRCAADLRERARTGKLTEQETETLRAANA